MTRRSLLATLAAIFLSKPKALPMPHRTVTGMGWIRITEHHFTIRGNRWMARTAGKELIDVQRSTHGFPFHFDGTLETQLVSEFRRDIDFISGDQW